MGLCKWKLSCVFAIQFLYAFRFFLPECASKFGYCYLVLRQPVMDLMCDNTTQMYRTLCFSLAVIVPTSPPQAPVPVPVGHGGGGHPPVPVPALPPPPPVQAPMHVPPIVGHNGKFKCITIGMVHPLMRAPYNVACIF